MRILSVLVLFMLAGCLTTDPAGPGKPTAKSGVEDKNLLAGATSSTNWPQEDAGSKFPYLLGSVGSADSVATFKIFDTSRTSMKVSRTVTLYKGGTIPAFDAPESTEFIISNTDHFSIPSASLHLLKDSESDTLTFSILLKSNTYQALITGFTYAFGPKKIINSPYTGKPNLSVNLTDPHYGIHGVPDSNLSEVRLYPEGKLEWCFYIPGSPFFFRKRTDTAITIGPVPNGEYPIRLLRFLKNDGGTNQVEVYEILKVDGPIDATHHTPYKILRLGAKLFVTHTGTSTSIRSEMP